VSPELVSKKINKMTMIKDQATPANSEQAMNTEETPESGHGNAENNEKTDKVEERKPRRSSRSPVVKKNPEDDENLDPVTKIILAKKITEFSAEHGRDPSEDEIKQMFEDTIRVLAGELVDESFVCDHNTAEPQEDAEDIAEDALPIELTDAPAEPVDAEQLKKSELDALNEDDEAMKKPKSNETVPTAASAPPQATNNAEEEPEAMSARPESKETGQAKSVQEGEDEKSPQETDSKVAQPKATEVNCEENVSVPTETKEQSPPNKVELPPHQDEMTVDDAAKIAVDDAAQKVEDKKDPKEMDSEIAQPEATKVNSEDKVAVLTETEKQSSPNEEELPPYQEEMAADDAAGQSGLKKRKRDISTEDVETVKKLKTNMAVEP